MVAKDIRWIRLFDPENHNISWASHIPHTNPGKRDKSDPSFKRQWSRLFHCAVLAACYAYMDRPEEARAELRLFEEAWEREKVLIGEHALSSIHEVGLDWSERYSSSVDREHFLEGLRKAGWEG